MFFHTDISTMVFTSLFLSVSSCFKSVFGDVLLPERERETGFVQ